MRSFRRVRHWKQRFNRDGSFIWSRAILFKGVVTKSGEPIPCSLSDNKNKLRRFWNSGTIQLAPVQQQFVLKSLIPAT